MLTVSEKYTLSPTAKIVRSGGDADRECMTRLQAGDDRALSELMLRWQDRLIGTIYRCIRDKTTSADLAQETFIRVYRHRHRFTSGSFAAWMFSIAKNLSLNHVRWASCRQTVSLPSVGEVTESPLENVIAAEQIPTTETACGQILLIDERTATPSESLETSERAMAVNAAIQSLPNNLQVVVVLAEYLNMTYRQIADALNCSEKAVETRLYRARKLLRIALEGFRE